jgi:RHS repeat-associated protein
MLSPISSRFPLAKNSLSSQRLRLTRMMSRYTAIVLLASMLTLSVPAPVAAAVMREGMRRSTDLATRANAAFFSWFGSINSQDRGQRRGMPPPPMNSRGVKPPPPPSREDNEARAASIQINPSGSLVLQSRQPMLFSAIPVDSQGVTIQGLQAEWESSNKQIVFINKNGQAVAGRPGTAILTAKAGRARARVRVSVIEGSREKFGGKKKENSRRPRRQAGRSTPAGAITNVARTFDNKKQHASSFSHPAGKRPLNTRAPRALLPLRDPNEDPLPDDETGSLYQPANSVGAPPGKTRPGGFTPSVAAEGTETGNKNFTFGLPVVNLPGRGIDISLDLTYNSLLYNKSTDPFDSSTWLTYDVDSGYPAPGFRLGYGQIEDQGGFGFTLTDADGTRHALTYTSAYNYDSNDGTFIHFTGGSGWGTLFYTDGTRVSYGAAGGGYRSYPTQITDRNGNYILISYEGGVGPRINSIKDTLGRYVRFYYAANGDLMSITAPGLTGHPDREIMRFLYEDITFNASTLFSPSVNVDMPGSSHVLKYIFLSNSVEANDAHTGYRFDYSAYGMIYQTMLFHGMVLNSGSTAVSNEGTQAAVTTYDYPGTPLNSASGLLDLPTYSTRTDDWAGRTTGINGNSALAPFYTFSVNETTGVTTVSAPNGAVTETHAIVNPGQWNDGMVSETFIDKQGSTALSHSIMDWEQGPDGSPRVSQVRTTNEAGQTKATVLSYTSSYNNIAAVSERDFTTDGSVSPIELRRTETAYVTSSSYVNRHLLRLPASVKVFSSGSSTPASRVDFGYDDYGSDHVNLTSRDDIIMHEPAFDPFAQTEETCNWECTSYDEWGNCNWEWVCNYYTPYDPATDYRGNVTSVTTYPDAASASNPVTHASTYDIAGNVITEQVNCCQLKTFSYTDSPNTHTYAYQVSEIRGDPNGLNLTAGATYDVNTGLIATRTDANSQVTTNFYHSDSLRLDRVEYPGGGVTKFEYSSALTADQAGKFHFYVSSSSKLDSPGGTPRWVDSVRYFDGRGALARTFDKYTAADGWATRDIEYDIMGRVYRTSNPYYSPGYISGGINPDGFWTTTAFDHLGRITQITMPRGDNDNSLTTSTQAQYDGAFTTLTDQAGRSRRQKIDALGRVVRLDEPDLAGNLGSTTAPAQATSYEYNVLDNLVHIAQDSQHRYFKYDSLSRLIRERQVEQDANSSYNLSDPITGNSFWNRKVEYNSDGLVTDDYDARGGHTQFSYDGLNRITQITYSDSTPAVHYYYDSQALPGGAPSYPHGPSTGRLIAVTYGSSSAVTGNYYGYDNTGRIVIQKQVTGSSSYSLSYAYNLSGLLTNETYPSGRSVNYSYDEGARLSQVSDGTTTFASALSYVPHGGLKSETWGNGAVHSQSYNRRLQISELKLKQSITGSELQRYNYSYGQVTQNSGSVDTSKNNGQVGRIDSFINGAATKEWDHRFVYDSLSRISTAAEYQQGNNSALTWQAQYTYDRYGNRFQSGSGNFGITYTPVLNTDIVESTNRFVTSGLTPTTYDAGGNITTDTKFRGMNYSYDANGRQTFAERTDHTSAQTSVYDCAGQRVRTTANGVTRTMVYDIFGQNVADYAGSNGGSLERENIYRGSQLLSVVEISASSASAPSGLAATPSGGGASVTLSWDAAAGATNYRVERKGAGGSYTLAGTTASTGFTDNGVSNGNAYLYKVCAADGSGSCTSTFSNVVLGAAVSFNTNATITTFAENPSMATTVKAAHITELRSAVNAVRSLAGLSAATWTNPTLTPGVSQINKSDIQDLRVKLDEALSALGIPTAAYTDDPLAGTPSGTLIKRVHITELRLRATSGSGTTGSGGACYKSISQFVKDFHQGVLKRQPNSSELSYWTETLSHAQLQGQAQLMSAAQSLGTMLFNSTEYANLNTTNAQYITDLYAGYLQRTPDSGGYNFWLANLNGGESRANIRQGFALSTEFQNNVSALCTPTGTSSGVKYVLSDTQGSARAVMSSGTYGSSSIIARHDYLPFGEEIWSGTGLRTTAQGYNTTDKIRQKYAMTERDDVTGLDHTVWRKYEGFAGRWTTPDPYLGSMSVANAQGFNRYAYVGNDPVNLIDPTGLYWAIDWGSCRAEVINIADPGGDPILRFSGRDICNLVWVDDRPFFDPGPGPGGGGPVLNHQAKKKKPSLKDKIAECAEKLFGVTMTNFVFSLPGQDGAFTGTGPDVLKNKGNNATIIVYNDASSMSMSGIGTNWSLGGPVMGFTPNPNHPFNQAHGYDPYTNYTGNDLTNTRAVQATQVHELGNSLAMITGIFSTMNGTISPPQFGTDRDPGVAMERCVFGGDVNSKGKLFKPGKGP